MFVTNETIGKILKAIEGCSLKYLVNFDEPTEKQKKICSELGVKLFFLPEIEELVNIYKFRNNNYKREK